MSHLVSRIVLCKCPASEQSSIFVLEKYSFNEKYRENEDKFSYYKYSFKMKASYAYSSHEATCIILGNNVFQIIRTFLTKVF